jgi:hypothetical protein
MVAGRRITPKKASAKPASKTPRRPQLDKMANGTGGYNKSLTRPEAPTPGNKRPQLDKQSPGTGRVRVRMYDNPPVGVKPRYSGDKMRPWFTRAEWEDAGNAQDRINRREWDKQSVGLRVTTPGRRRNGTGK